MAGDLDSCRLCMKTRGVRTGVFESRQDSEPIATLLERHLGIELRMTEGLPSKACNQCTTTIDAFIGLRETIIATQNELEILAARVEVLSEESVHDVEIVFESEEEVLLHSSHLPLEDGEEETEATTTTATTTRRIQDSVALRAKGRRRKPFSWTEKEKEAIDSEMIKRNFLVCTVCQQGGWTTYQDLRNHARVAHKARPFIVCCGLKYMDTVAMEHMQFHMDEDIFKCPTCGKKFGSRCRLKAHCDRMHFNPKFAKHCCETCGKYFRSTHEYANHMKTHSDVKDFICEVCGMAFVTDQLMKSHRKRNHVEKRSTACPVCGVHVFFLRRHMVMKHTEREMIPCKFCGKPQDRSHYKTHIEKTHSERNHVCSVCSKAFRTRDKLSTHMNIHLGIRVPCHFCDHTATNNGNLCTHMSQKHPLEYAEYKIQRRRTPLVKNTKESSTLSGGLGRGLQM